MLKRVLKIFTPLRIGVVSTISIFGFFGIKANNIMDYGWLLEAAKWSLLSGLFIFSVYAYYHYKAQHDQQIQLFHIEKNKDEFRHYLFNGNTHGLCPSCNNNSFDVVGASKIPNYFLASKKERFVPILLLGCHSCGYIQLINLAIVQDNLNST